MSHSPISDKDALAAARAISTLVGLEIIPEHRAGVATNLARLMQQAELVMAVPLPADVEPASLFTP